MWNSYIIDGHCDSLIRFVDQGKTLRDTASGGHWDIQSARRSGMALQFLAAFIDGMYKPGRALQRGLQLLEGAHRFISSHEDSVFLVQGKSELERIPDAERLGILLSVEGGEILEEDLFLVDIIFKLGVRSLGLTWNQRNALGTGVGEGDAQSPLTSFGQAVVRRMNELGILIDISHLNEGGFWHVLELSQYPIAATHSCARALCDHPRNLSDRQLRAMADRKGVVGVNFCPLFLQESGRATREDVIRHICHIADVAGIETVGLGSDFDGIEETPAGLAHVGDESNLDEDLSKAGFSPQEVFLIKGGNFKRLLSEVLK